MGCSSESTRNSRDSSTLEAGSTGQLVSATAAIGRALQTGGTATMSRSFGRSSTVLRPARGRAGRPRKRLDRVLASRGYDDKYRRDLWARGVSPRSLGAARSTTHDSRRPG